MERKKLLRIVVILSWCATGFLHDISVVCLKFNSSVCTKLRSRGVESVFVCGYFERQMHEEMHKEHRM